MCLLFVPPQIVCLFMMLVAILRFPTPLSLHLRIPLPPSDDPTVDHVFDLNASLSLCTCDSLCDLIPPPPPMRLAVL